MGNELLIRYQDEIKSIKSSLGIKITSIEEVEDNEVFLLLKDSFETYFTIFNRFVIPLNFETSTIHSIVELKKGVLMKIQNCLYFELPGGSHFRFSPHKQDSLEITRVMVNPKQANQGLGTEMMLIFFEFVGSVLGEIPPLYLECTGSVGWGDSCQINPIGKQTAFFRKFGFRVKNGKDYPTFISMEREREIIN